MKPTRRIFSAIAQIVVNGLLLSATLQAASPVARPARLDDVFWVEQFRDSVISPAGGALAFLKQRAINASPLEQRHEDMLISADFDHVDVGHSELAFRALASMRKPARLVRYWAEDHIISSPSDVRDRWQRIFAWFDQHGDILRDEKGNMVWDKDRVKSRGTAAPMQPEDFSRFDLFGPGGAEG